MHLHVASYFFLIFIGLFAGMMDTIAGGGGMLTVPALLSVGLPPATALGTNRLQSVFGESTALARFLRGGLKLKRTLLGMIFTIIGSGLGTWVIQIIHPKYLQKIIPFILIVLLLYILFSPHFRTNEKREEKISFFAFNIILGLLIGFYNGFFGPATGSFWIIVYVYFLGFSLRDAVMSAKPMNLVGNIVSVIVFAIGHHVAYFIGIMMAIGQFVGANLGAYIVLSKSSRFIRPIFILMVSAMVIRLLWKAYF